MTTRPRTGAAQTPGGRMMTIDEVIEDVIAKEGGYSNDPRDAGGETNWGITVAVARANGFKGPMRDLPRATAKAIYERQYVIRPGFDRVGDRSPAIGAELVDTGVNMGPAVAAIMLQRSLNALNRGGKDYPDIGTDGAVGPATLRALERFLAVRGKEGEAVMLKALNCLQGERYISLAEKRGANEAFLFGWLRTRVA